jgi:hypothetical protein
MLHPAKEPIMKVQLPLALFAALTMLQSFTLAPALADAPAVAQRAIVATQPAPAALQPCPANTLNIAQLDCCKGHKGICGCRAGKIVCCDGTVSTDPNCTCHGDDAIDN